MESGDVSSLAENFDHHAPEFVESSHSVYARLRAECPIPRSGRHGGFYVATRYADVASMARNDALFSSEWRADGSRDGVSIPRLPHGHGFIEMDPPESLKYRRAINPMFSPSAVEELLPRIRHHITAAIDDFIERGECDIVHDFADRVPAAVTLEMMGLPSENWRRWVDYFHGETSHDIDDPSYHELYGAENWALTTLQEAIADRRARPRPDGLTWVISREIDGQPMRDDAAVEVMFLLMVGGFDTSAAIISNSLFYLSQNPGARLRLMEDPGLLDSACEEFLRYYSPVQTLARTVTADVDVSGVRLKAGDRVLLSWASADLDGAEFPDPEEIILDRFPNRHVAFGVGTHRCAGSHLARAEFRIALEETFSRLPDLRIDPATAVRYPSIGFNNGWLSMPARFRPGRRRLSELAAAP